MSDSPPKTRSMPTPPPGTPTAGTPLCPLPLSHTSRILMAHGGGGKMSKRLYEEVFLPAFAPTSGPPASPSGFGSSLTPDSRSAHDSPAQALLARHDGAVVPFPTSMATASPGSSPQTLTSLPPRLAFTTDSHVVSPLFFPGGDIGKLAIYGTVNDLAMCGARPLYLSAGFILEEGLPVEILQRVVQSMAEAAREVGVHIITGDTKVVERGKGDGIFINTSGIGEVWLEHPPSPARLVPGDVLLVSGDLGRHGMAILAQREGLAFESEIDSDCASVVQPVLALLQAGFDVHCLRDLTRGGLVSALCELSETAGVAMRILEQALPVQTLVRSACELLGLDPLHVANEGRFVCALPAAQASDALKLLQSFPVSAGACRVGEVLADAPPHAGSHVRLRLRTGTDRLLDMISGEQLPRIC